MKTIHIQVLYALPKTQKIIDLDLPESTTALEAVKKSGLLERFPEIDLENTHKLGIYAKLIKSDTPLRDKDRIEIYRPLIADPKAVRRKRAEEGKVMKKGGGEA